MKIEIEKETGNKVIRVLQQKVQEEVLLQFNDKAIGYYILRNICRISYPRVKHWPNYGGAAIGDIMMRPNGLGGGTTRKAGNIIFDTKRLLNELMDGSLAIVGSLGNPYLLIVTVLNVYRKICGLKELRIEERHAIVVVYLWAIKPKYNNNLSSGNLLSKVNQQFGRLKRGYINQQELTTILSELDKLKCIKLEKDGSITLSEKLIVRY